MLWTFTANMHGLSLLKIKKGTTNTNAFKIFLKECNRCEAKSKGCKPNKIRVDKGGEF